MKPSFYPRLVNDPFSDPGLYIPFLYEKRAIMFDLGEIMPLTPRDLLKITHVFVSHTHMDHFTGFDKLLRIFLGRDSALHLFGPPGFFSHVEGKLNGYVWNLVQEYEYNLTLNVTEVHENRAISKRYFCREGFRPGEVITGEIIDGILYKTAGFQVRGALLDHRIPCLGLTLEEDFHVNINSEGLKSLGLDTGPWLTAFKKEIYAGSPGDDDFFVTKEEHGKIVDKKKFTLGSLVEKIATITPGQKITYITDVIGSDENIKKIIELARGADQLFIEAAFLAQDSSIAKEKYHLTAAESGRIAREAGAKKFTLFHFSPRYSHMEKDITNEAMEAYKGR
ncbi:MAG: ribonuclease Z [Deltaproteobacteria bacterium]|nr:ribonuclease Z [Deltaproteobacteria bacterium]